MAAPPARVVVIGLGSELRGDDAIGPVIARRLRGRLPKSIAVRELAGDPLAMIAAWEGAELVVAIDAAVTGAAPGTVHRRDLGAWLRPKDLGRCSSHGFGLAEALALAEPLGRRPARLILYAIEAAGFEPGAPLSIAVEATAVMVIERVMLDIEPPSR